MFMEAIVDQKPRHMADLAALPAETQDEFIIAAVQEILVPVQANPVMDRLADEKRLVNHVTHRVSEHVVIVAGFLAPVDVAALAIHILDVAKERIPVRMLLKGLAHGPQCPRDG